MKNNIKYGILLFAGCLLSLFYACDDYLDFEKPASVDVNESFLTADNAVAFVTSAYFPMLWEYQNNGGTFFSEWWIGDVCSDDALKGGQFLSDMDLVYDMENFKTRSDNNVLLWFYRVQYMGIFRCNLALENIPLMDPEVFAESEAGLQNRTLGEALFMRAFYYFRLARVFGGVPWVDKPIKYQEDWRQPRVSEDDLYREIYNDLKTAIQYLPEKSDYRAEDAGRATKGAARALLMKAYLNQHDYNNAKLQGDSIILSGEYQLVADYNELFSENGENSTEAVFEAQYTSQVIGDGWDGLGSTDGTLVIIQTRPRWNGGWGFNRPSQELYDEFESGDPRRDAAIYNPTEDQVSPSDDSTDEGDNDNVYLGNRYTARKYSMMRADSTWVPLSHATWGEINRREIRYADVLLLYAEACVKASTPDLAQAKWALEEVRRRARVSAGPQPFVAPGILPPFPNYTIKLQGVGQADERRLQDNAEDLYLAIQHERRVELAMEGHRWFDLVRWGIAAEVMNHYGQTTKAPVAKHMAEFVKGKHERFPIPMQERDLNSQLSQNPGYDGVPVQ
jgi:hypothetical protein